MQAKSLENDVSICGKSIKKVSLWYLTPILFSLLHDKDGGSIEGVEQDRKLSRNAREVETESISYCVCRKLFGFDTGEYSFSYVTSWSQGKEIKVSGTPKNK